MKLNRKHLKAIDTMLGTAINWHMIFWMQDDQDLEPGFRRRELQRRERWKKAMEYHRRLIKRIEGGAK